MPCGQAPRLFFSDPFRRLAANEKAGKSNTTSAVAAAAFFGPHFSRPSESTAPPQPKPTSACFLRTNQPSPRAVLVTTTRSKRHLGRQLGALIVQIFGELDRQRKSRKERACSGRRRDSRGKDKRRQGGHGKPRTSPGDQETREGEARTVATKPATTRGRQRVNNCRDERLKTSTATAAGVQRPRRRQLAAAAASLFPRLGGVNTTSESGRGYRQTDLCRQTIDPARESAFAVSFFHADYRLRPSLDIV